MEGRSFKLLFNNKVFHLNPFKKLMDISINIRDSLIFNSSHDYQVESNVNTEIVENLIKYLETDEVPEININNINEYMKLSSEFMILENEINEKKNEYGEYFVNLQGLHSNDSEEKSKYEMAISEHLDEYLVEYGNELMKSPIHSLYNIFNSEARKLTNEDLAYDLIKAHFDDSNDIDVFILLDTLSMNKLSQKNCEESISLYLNRHRHMPKLDYSMILNIIESRRAIEERFDDLETKFALQQKEMEKLELKLSMIENDKQTMSLKHEEEISELELKIDKLNDEIELKKEEDIEKSHQLDDSNEKISTLELKIIELNKELRFKDEEVDKYHRIIDSNDEQCEKYEQTIKDLNNAIEEKKLNINQLESEIRSQKIKNSKALMQNICHPFEAGIDMKSPGIFSRLKQDERIPFNRLFIPSQSSFDIYNVIYPQTNDSFELRNGDFIEFELEESITVNGIKLFSSSGHFAKSFDIALDDQKVVTISEANELNGKKQDMLISINSIQCKKIKIIITGPNWTNSKYIHFKRIEIYSNDSIYSRGVFETLVSLSENQDPHKCPVIISSSKFDFNIFHLIDASSHIFTHSKENSWFQIEFTCGTVILKGFRLKRSDPGRINNYKIICTNDVFMPEEKWTTLIEIKEQSKDEHQLLDIYEFPQASPPSKFVRIIQIGLNWNNRSNLEFSHLDFFGAYTPL